MTINPKNGLVIDVEDDGKIVGNQPSFKMATGEQKCSNRTATMQQQDSNKILVSDSHQGFHQCDTASFKQRLSPFSPGMPEALGTKTSDEMYGL